MGTDIHLLIEELYPGDGLWHADRFEGEFVWRDYSVFHQLAGVRCAEEREKCSQRQPVGLPDDMSVIARSFFGCSDYHSLTWWSGEMLYELLFSKRPGLAVKDMRHFEAVVWPHLWSSYSRSRMRFLMGFDC